MRTATSITNGLAVAVVAMVGLGAGTAGNGFAYFDAVVVDFTIPPPAGTVILVR